MSNLFDFKLVFTQLPDLIRFLPITLELALLSMLLGLALGLVLAIVKIRQVKILKSVATFFISAIRGTPILVQLYIAYFGIPMFFKWLNQSYGTDFHVAKIDGFIYAVVALGINQSAYNAEFIRAAILSVGEGQIEAASALGMNYFQTLFRIIVPEAITVALPSLGNSLISVIKGTSLAFTCAVVEMTAQGKIIGGRTYRYFEVYVSLAIIYWVITVVIEKGLSFVEKKLAIPEQVANYIPLEPGTEKVKAKQISKYKVGKEVENDRDRRIIQEVS
ncbi:amino acid ABC transporter permease [Butyrivibrio sp. VCB2006]|uniref:amino acid ABC transporter permease n=1 Tax=Butyrivibrio sp. VCB2006 TaxID=1280679 RepID=UPI000492D709|nr:amino acid ABC transporter permease [Butyrivibrio sp. VCB2006]